MTDMTYEEAYKLARVDNVRLTKERDEARAEIERLVCEVNRAKNLHIQSRDGRTMTQGAFNHLMCNVDDLEAKLAAARAENERLRGLLRTSIDCGVVYEGTPAADSLIDKIKSALDAGEVAKS